MKSIPRAPLLLLALLASAGGAAAQQPTTVILVRHAEKVTSNPADHDPVLTAAGQARARELARVLRRMHVDAVITTQYRRAVETAAPFAAAHHLTPEVIDAHQAGGAVRPVVESITTRHAGQTVLVVGHTNTVPEIIRALGGPRMEDIPEWQYGDMFVLKLTPGAAPSLVSRTYGARSRAPATASRTPAMRP